MFPHVDPCLALAEHLVFSLATWVAQYPLVLLPLCTILCGSALLWFLSLNV